MDNVCWPRANPTAKANTKRRSILGTLKRPPLWRDKCMSRYSQFDTDRVIEAGPRKVHMDHGAGAGRALRMVCAFDVSVCILHDARDGLARGKARAIDSIAMLVQQVLIKAVDFGHRRAGDERSLQVILLRFIHALL